MADTLRVATWNIKHGGKANHGHKGYIGNPQEVGECCATLDADILALQEVDRYVWRSKLKDLVQIVADATGMKPHFGQTTGFNLGAAINPGGRYGNALFVRGGTSDVTEVPLHGDYKRLKLRGKRHDMVREQRGAIIARALVHNHEIDIAVTHLGGKEIIRHSQLATVAGILACRPGPYVMLGDFNTNRTDTSNWLKPYSMTLVPAHPTCPLPEPKRHIDHIAVKGLDIIGSEPRYFSISDHAALVAELSFTDAQS